jgi:hypothetical protein
MKNGYARIEEVVVISQLPSSLLWLFGDVGFVYRPPSEIFVVTAN